MSFFTVVKVCFLKYFNFSGRASRAEFWLFMLFLILTGSVIAHIPEQSPVIFYMTPDSEFHTSAFYQLLEFMEALEAQDSATSTFLLGAFMAAFVVSVILNPVELAFILATIIPSVSVTARRLHDIDRSGWWTLIHFIPLFGVFWLIYWWCKKGNAEENRFGPRPEA